MNMDIKVMNNSDQKEKGENSPQPNVLGRWGCRKTADQIWKADNCGD